MKTLKITAWERLENTRNVVNDILDVTKNGLPMSEEEQASIQQELIKAVGSLVKFSECLPDNIIHKA